MKKLTLTLIVIATILSSCNFLGSNKDKIKTNPLAEKYTEVPKDELMVDTGSAPIMYKTLSDRYTNSLLSIKKETDVLGIKLGVAFLTPECGNSATLSQKKGKGIIEALVAQNGIDYVDLTKTIADKDPLVVTQMPKDGHFSKEGARLAAADLMNFLVTKYKGYVAPVSDNLKSKPKVFGDLEPNMDEVLDGNKDIPYRLVTNSQGLRMNNEVAFPKKKQRILLFGDSVFFCPFLDNGNGIAEQLQAMYPDAEIINTANWGYTLEDYLTLFQEKAKYLEPDVIIIQTSGNDILDYYFSNRLKLSRNIENVKSTEAEIAYYNELYKK